METTKKETAKNEEINRQTAALTDLPVTEEQADEAKGGGTVSIKNGVINLTH